MEGREREREHRRARVFVQGWLGAVGKRGWVRARAGHPRGAERVAALQGYARGDVLRVLGVGPEGIGKAEKKIHTEKEAQCLKREVR